MILTFKRVLVTTDFSEPGDAAVPPAFRIASDHGAEVLLCHVIETPPTPNPLYAHYSSTELYRPEAGLQAEAKAHEALRARVPKDATLAAVPYRTRVVDGDPVARILEVTREEEADLLVIATHGRTGLKHFFLGSVVERVVRQAH